MNTLQREIRQPLRDPRRKLTLRKRRKRNQCQEENQNAVSVESTRDDRRGTSGSSWREAAISGHPTTNRRNSLPTSAIKRTQRATTFTTEA